MIEINQKPKLPPHPLPIIIIGAGGIVSDGHLPAYALAGFPVVGIYDIQSDKAEALQSRFPFIQQVYRSMDEVVNSIKSKDVVVDLAVPASQILEVLNKLPDLTNVLIQKPMGENLEQARRILELCQHKNFKAGVNFQLRFAPYIIAARQMIDSGMLGKVYDYEFKVCVHTPWNLWKFLYHAPRVEILYHSIHYLDLIRSLAGSPSKIYASTVRHPNMAELSSTRSTVIMDYDGMLQGRFITNHGHVFGPEHEDSYFKIEGTGGAIKIRIGVSLDYPKGRPPRFEYIFSSDDRGWQELPLVGGWFPHAFIGTMAGMQLYCLGLEKTLNHNVLDGFETMRWVEKAYQSSESGGIR